MSSRKASDSKSKKRRPEGPPPDGPDVFVDIVFEDGLLYVSVGNIGPRPAADVSVQFRPAFRGLGGRVVISDLRLFKGIALLAPHREIRTLLDTSAAYFARKEPVRIAATVTFRDLEGNGYRRTLEHDLRIYEDLTYRVRSDRTLD